MLPEESQHEQTRRFRLQRSNTQVIQHDDDHREAGRDKADGRADRVGGGHQNHDQPGDGAEGDDYPEWRSHFADSPLKGGGHGAA